MNNETQNPIEIHVADSAATCGRGTHGGTG